MSACSGAAILSFEITFDFYRWTTVKQGRGKLIGHGARYRRLTHISVTVVEKSRSIGTQHGITWHSGWHEQQPRARIATLRGSIEGRYTQKSAINATISLAGLATRMGKNVLVPWDPDRRLERRLLSRNTVYSIFRKATHSENFASVFENDQLLESRVSHTD